MGLWSVYPSMLRFEPSAGILATVCSLWSHFSALFNGVAFVLCSHYACQ